MRRNCTQIVFACLLWASLSVFLSCDDRFHDEMPPVPRKVEVGIYAGGTQTRTEMLPDGLGAVWEDGDVISVWAKNSSGNFTLGNQPFITFGTDGQRGFFTSELDAPMTEDTYTYYCCYPQPESVSGDVVTFNIPAIQDGTASGGADVMIATPVRYGALAPLPEPEDHSGMRMEMNRMMHQFRFYIPSENTVVNDEKLKRILLTFPSGVVGNVSLDITDPTVSATLAEEATGNIDMKLAKPIGKSGENPDYACLVIAPKQFAPGESLKIKAYTEDKIAYFDDVDLCARDFKGGHSTPVLLNVREIADYPYRITFTISQNNLGENVNSITLTAPEGCDWDGTGSSVYTYSPGHKVGAWETFSLRFEDEAQYRKFGLKDISVVYDSDHAITSQTVRIPDLSSVDVTAVYLQIPYLFYEDFSGIPSFNDGHDNPSVIHVNSWSDFKNLVSNLGSISDTYVDISDLSGYALGGWYGTRVAGQSGTAVRICCRYEHVVAAGAYYKGRIYSPRLSAIKEGMDANISVSFRYGADRKELDPGVFGEPADKLPVLYFGMNTQETITNPDKNEGDIIDSITGLIGGSGYASSSVSSLSPMAIRAETLTQLNNSYTSFTGVKTVTVSGVDNAMRLSWVLSTNNDKSNVHANYWLYLDDIKVQIAN